MAFCVQCGNKVGDADSFCRKCGARQPAAGQPSAGPANASGASRPAFDPAAGMSGRTASLLCYIPWIGWIAAIVVLASQRFRHEVNVRFHAFQGLYLFVVWLIVDHVMAPFFDISGHVLHLPFHSFVGDLLKVAVFAGWVFMMIKVSHDEHYRLPIIGELAERSVSEQRS